MCNQYCTYCYHSKENAKQLPFQKGFMSAELAEDIIMEAGLLGVPSLKFNWRGESTMNPNFRRITAFAKSLAGKGTFQERITNSNFKFNTMNEDIFEGLCNQTKVKVSMDSFNTRVMETQRAGSKHWLTLANIDKFYNHPSRTNTELVIQAVRTKLNATEDIYGLAKKRWPEAAISVRDVVEGRTEGEYKDLVNNKLDHSDRQSCLQAHVRLIVHWDGKVSPCCPSIRNDLIIGKFPDRSLRQIFNSLEAKGLRRDLNSKKAFNREPCKSCSSFESYAGYKPSWHS